MKNEISIPILRAEDALSAAKRREVYSLKRDIQAREYNEAIALRHDKEKEEEE